MVELSFTRSLCFTIYNINQQLQDNADLFRQMKNNVNAILNEYVKILIRKLLLVYILEAKWMLGGLCNGSKQVCVKMGNFQ